MNKPHIAISVNILDREYQVACEAGQEDSLKASAKYLDNKMREIRDKGNVIGIDRIAVMAALNMANEFLQLKPISEEQRSLAKRMVVMQQKISQAIAADSANQPELI